MSAGIVDCARLEEFARLDSDWLWETDCEDRLTFLSLLSPKEGLALALAIGQRRDEMASRDPDNLARLEAISERIRARKPFRNMVFLAQCGADAAWLSTSGAPIHASDGTFQGYRGVGRDVTSVVEAQLALERKSRALDVILSAIPDGVRVIDATGKTLAMNPQIHDITQTTPPPGPDGMISMKEAMLEHAQRGEYGAGDPELLAKARLEKLERLIERRGNYSYQRQTTGGRWFEGRLRSLGDGGLLMLYRDISDSKQREHELERQSLLLAAMVSNIEDGISVFDDDRRLVLWNDQYPRLIGLEPSSIHRGLSARDVLVAQARNGEFGPGDPEVIADRRMEDVDRQPGAVYERVRPNGRVIQVRRHPLPGGGAVSIYIDVTERNQAEFDLQELNDTLEQRIAERTSALADSERFLRNLVANVPGMVYRCRYDRARTMQFASDGCRNLLGLEPEALTGGAIISSSLVHPEEQDLLWEKVRADFARGDSFELEYRVRHADGSWRWVWDRANAVRDENGHVLGLEGLILDIGDRKQAERQAREARDNLLDAIESVSSNLVLYDAEGRLLLFNQHLLDHYPGNHDQFVVGRKFEDIFRAVLERGNIALPPGRTIDEVVAERTESLLKADGRVFERILPDGRILHITEQRARSGGIVSVGQDVTARLKMEAQLREAQRMEAIGQLTGGLAHDLNNYLAVIMGNLDLLTEHAGGDPEAVSLVEGALAGARRGAELTRSLLAFSRRQPLDPRVQDVGHRIRDLGRLLGRTLGEKIKVDIQIESGLWPVRIDGAQLDSSIVNLANNARDAMPEGGRLRIVASNSPAGPGTADHDRVAIEVADMGSGMSADVLAQAFDPFFSTKEVGHGTGLGLSMVHGFVHQSGGTIALDSSPGRGTTVRLYLPRSTVRGEQIVQRATPDVPGGTESVLVVEDNDSVREIVVAQLESLGYRVRGVENGDAALRILEERPDAYDLVLTDVVMPGNLDGNALARLAAKRWPDLRVMLTTGFAGESANDEIQGVVLRKPYRKRELANAVRAVLSS